MNAEFEEWYKAQFPGAALVKDIFDQHDGEYINASVFWQYEQWIISCVIPSNQETLIDMA